MHVSRECLQCKAAFTVSAYVASLGKGKFCSKRCSDAYKVGKKHSEDHKRRISSALKGRTWKVVDTSRFGKHRIGVSPWNKGRKLPSGANHHNYGKHWKIKDTSRFGKLGELNPRWRGGVSKDKQYVSWVKNKRNRVLKRLQEMGETHSYDEWVALKAKYGFACACCKAPESSVRLTVDHIVPLSRGGCDKIDNVQPLCMPCNARKHTLTIKY